MMSMETITSPQELLKKIDRIEDVLVDDRGYLTATLILTEPIAPEALIGSILSQVSEEPGRIRVATIEHADVISDTEIEIRTEVSQIMDGDPAQRPGVTFIGAHSDHEI